MANEPVTVAPPEKSDSERKAELKNIADKLKRQEETSTPGASTLAPKQMLLDARAAQAKNPDKRIRWVSLKNPDKMLARQSEGYTVVPADRGGKRLGDNLVLMEIPREKHEARIRREQALHKARLNQHKSEMAALAERLAKELRDRHGLDIDVNRLLVNEGA